MAKADSVSMASYIRSFVTDSGTDEEKVKALRESLDQDTINKIGELLRKARD